MYIIVTWLIPIETKTIWGTFKIILAYLFVKYYYFNIKHMHEATTITDGVARKTIFPAAPLKILNNNQGVINLKELEDMNKEWKYRTLISFGVAKKIKMNSFISWHKLIDNALNNDIVKSYMTLQ